MSTAAIAGIRAQLLDRRTRLERALRESGAAADLLELLGAVDSALGRLDTPAWSHCAVCGESVDDDVLRATPLAEYCLCSLSDRQRAALEHDLALARRVQLSLLPRQDVVAAGWHVHHRYIPAGVVSGDYCDLVGEGDSAALFAMLGDVSGKGLAASLVMARLNALVRSLVEQRLPPHDLVARANRLFSEGAGDSHYATLVCARATPRGELEICNAGHCPPLLLHGGHVTAVDSTGFPVGLVEHGEYETHRVSLAPGDTLLLYSDGVTEAVDAQGRLYGQYRLMTTLQANGHQSPGRMTSAILADVDAHRGATPRADDVTLMVVHRAA
ncbi:MAG: PP2C family protein-serine/threonine phosphatase [Phycisphaerae bacterium]